MKTWKHKENNRVFRAVKLDSTIWGGGGSECTFTCDAIHSKFVSHNKMLLLVMRCSVLYPQLFVSLV